MHRLFSQRWSADPGLTAILALFITFAAPPVLAATYYVDATVYNDRGDGSAQRPKRFISSGIALLSPYGGDTLIIRPGFYLNRKDAIDGIPSGRPGAWNTVKAEFDGTAVILQPLLLPRGETSYVQIEGLKWVGEYPRSITGHHIKILRCAFEGAAATGNTTTFGIGTNDRGVPLPHHILIEDSWFFGLGGRYNALTFNADKVIWRRVLLRHDGGWDDQKGDPEACITTYNASNVELQNVICLDSDPRQHAALQGFTSWEAGLYQVRNSGFEHLTDSSRITGSIVLNTTGTGIKYDGGLGVTRASIDNTVIWGTRYGIATNNGATDSPHDVRVTRVTIGNSRMKPGEGAGIGRWGAKTNVLSVDHSILYNQKAFVGTGSAGNNVCFGSGHNNCTADSDERTDPRLHGMQHITHTRSGSRLDKQGIGARIVYRIGLPGTLWGEPGYDRETRTPLWPWPNEDRIKQDLADIPGVGIRGWTATSQSLFDYINAQ